MTRLKDTPLYMKLVDHTHSYSQRKEAHVCRTISIVLTLAKITFAIFTSSDFYNKQYSVSDKFSVLFPLLKLEVSQVPPEE